MDIMAVIFALVRFPLCFSSEISVELVDVDCLKKKKKKTCILLCCYFL